MTRAFSLLLESEPSELDFIAPDEKVLDVLTDGLNALLGNAMSWHTTKKDLKLLLDMKIRIQMLGLEGITITIPYSPPPIPDHPPDYDFLQVDGIE